jgi:gamma-glutamyltranspeptidase/glutathione hydrolase
MQMRKQKVNRIMWAVAALLVVLGSSAAAQAAYRPNVIGKQGVVTSAHSLASEAGLQILRDGGNAIDAAVAVMAALNVVEPNASGAAGNGCLTIFWKPDGEVKELLMTGAAPFKMPSDGLSPEQRDGGILAGVTPGNYGGWIEALDKYGTKSLSEVLKPAIGYAENGFSITQSLSDVIESYRPILELNPTTAKIWLPGGKAPKAGTVVVQTDLANTFKKLCEAERATLAQGQSRSAGLKAAYDCFYTGDIAREIIDFYKENGGLFTRQDLASYRPEWVAPVTTNYRGYDVYSTPSTSRGGIELVMALNMIETYDVRKMGLNSAEELHLIAEIMKIVKGDVYQYVADPKFVDIPLEGMTSKEYAAARRSLINPDKAGPFPGPGRPQSYQKAEVSRDETAPILYTKAGDPSYVSSPGCTTSFSIVDRFGNAVGGTVTLGDFWGTKVVVGNTGLLFNNGTRDGSTAGKYPKNVNYPQPGKRGLLNNSPTIVLKDGKLVMVFGTPGGEGIGATQFQLLMNVVDFGMGMQEAIESPRFIIGAKPDFYMPGADVTWTIESRVDPKVIEKLKAMGHTIKVSGAFTSSVGGMQGILVDQDTGWLFGGGDPRRGGYAVGY